MGQASPGDRIRRLEIVVAELAVVRAGTEGWLELGGESVPDVRLRQAHSPACTGGQGRVP